MENVTEALIIAFSVLIFIIALTVSISIFSKAREVSDVIISKTDKAPDLTEQERTDVISYRIVGMETIAPTLYRYYKEETTIVFLQGAELDNDAVTGERVVDFSGVKPLGIYNTTSRNLAGTLPDFDNYGTTYYKGTRDTGASDDPDDDDYDPISEDDNKIAIDKFYTYRLNKICAATESNPLAICVIDLADEIARGENWIGNTERIKEHVRDMLNAAPLNDSTQKYIEIISAVEKEKNEDEMAGVTTAKKTTKRNIITYIRID